MGIKKLVCHLAAILNAQMFDNKKGGRTMPSNVTPTDKKPARYDHKQMINTAKPDIKRTKQQKGMDDPLKVKIGGVKYGLKFCKRVFAAAYPRGCTQWRAPSVSLDVLADTFDITKNVANAILQKGMWGKL